jgi:hypothetical protein
MVLISERTDDLLLIHRPLQAGPHAHDAFQIPQGYQCLRTRSYIEATVALLGSKWLDIVPKMTSGADLNRLEGAIRCFL